MLEDDGNNEFSINTPIYDASTQSGFNSVFGLGEKSIGEFTLGYQFTIVYDNTVGLGCPQNLTYNLTVLKTEEIEDNGPNGNRLRVWYKIDDIDLSECEVNSTGLLTNGFILAEFLNTIEE